MKEFVIISKSNCPKCDDLKNWMKANKVSAYKEWKIEDQAVVQKLLANPEFVKTFCDVDGCVVYTPVIHKLEENKFYFKELFGINGIRDKEVKKIIGL